MFTWAKVGKTKDIRDLGAVKVARPDLKGRGIANSFPRPNLAQPIVDYS